jgi:phosphoribosyl 1,2-cyclic phosphodiesterase
MPLRFTVLASGSAGNASLVQANGFGLLLDAGLGPRQLAGRLAAVGATWDQVDAVLLTHTHSDHWHDRTLAHLCRRGIPLYCHDEHRTAMLQYGSELASLQKAGLVHGYEAGQEWRLGPGLNCRALELSHDGGPTFGFRFEAEESDLYGTPAALGYAADLGSWTPGLARALADVDVLALEFNHDVALQHASGRSFHLIRRVLGDRGHLSNVQAAALVREAVNHSPDGRIRHLVQLHLSRDCNRPELALEAARAALGSVPVAIYTASQDTPGPDLAVGGSSLANGRPRTRAVRTRKARTSSALSARPWLPGFEPDPDTSPAP